MSDIDIAWQAAQDAAQALAPEVDLVADFDMAGFGGSLAAVLNRAMEHPFTVAEASLRLTTNLAQATQFATARAMGSHAPPPIEPERDKRFADPTWEDNPANARPAIASWRSLRCASSTWRPGSSPARCSMLAGATRSATARPSWPPGSCSTRSARPIS